jgi:hypothetical protein
MRVFMEAKSWEGCAGLEMTDEIKVTIATQACFMVLGFPCYCFDKVRSILVFPATCMVPGPHGNRHGANIFECLREPSGSDVAMHVET